MPPAPHRSALTVHRTALVLVLLLVGLSVTALHPPSARAVTITVTTVADPSSDSVACSLRDAIQAATSNAPVDGCPAGTASSDTITFAVTGTITLDSELGSLSVPSGVLTIQGPGAGSLTVSGGGATGILAVGSGADLTVHGLTLANGNSFDGGAIVNAGGSLSITSSTFSENSATGGGGAIHNNPGTVTITNSIFSGNTAAYGGTIEITVGTVTITNSTFSGNTAFASGAISNSGRLTLTSSTLSGNTASNGGAMVNGFGRATITNSTFSGNTATNMGGAILITEGASLALINSTIAANQSGANPVLGMTSGTVSVHNIVLANPSPSCGSGGTVVDLGGNIASDASCPFTQPSSKANSDPMLGPLQDNGGPTQTMAPLPDSPAIDAAVNCPPPATDQRGEPRTAPCASGAVEIDAAPIAGSLTPTSGPEAGGTRATITGQGFVPGQTTVTFGLTPALSVTCPSSTICQAVSPPGTGTVSVVVTVIGGGSASVVVGDFTYLPAPAPQPMTVSGQVRRQIPPIVSENQIELTVIPVVGAVVEALVDGTICGQGMTDGQGRFSLTVAADPPAAGCGRPGVSVTFWVNGERAASDPLTFQSGGAQSVTLTLPGPMPPPRR